MKSISLRLIGRRPSQERLLRSRGLHPTVERLDHRLALTGLAASVVVPDPEFDLPLHVEAVIPVRNPFANTSVVTDPASSPAFSIHFNHVIDFTMIYGDDFDVYRVNTDGSRSQLDRSSVAYLETADDVNPGGTSLLVSFTSPLAPGSYQLFLSHTNSLVDTNEVGTSPVDQLIESFPIGLQAASRLTSQQLPAMTQATTVLQFPVVNNDMNRPLNELDIPVGTSWSFTPAFGTTNPAHFRIALFNADKQLILSKTGSELASAAYTLTAGRYYIQVYQTTTIPTSLSPTLNITFTGLLNPTAAPAINSVTPVNRNGADSNADSLVVKFAAGNSPLDYVTDSRSVFAVMDDSGQTWPVQPSAYDPGSMQLLLAFGSYLPTGHYTLSVSRADPAVSSGTRVQQLGSFHTVYQALGSNQLGTIFPTASPVSWKNESVLASGQSVAQQFSIVQGEGYVVEVSNSQVEGQLFQLMQDGVGGTKAVLLGTTLGKSYYLEPGIYRVVVANPTAISQQVAFSVFPIDLDHESLSTAGIGQFPAALSQTTLVQNIPSSSISTSFPSLPETATTINLSSPASRAANHELVGAVSSKVESSGSFGVSTFVQTPFGSLSGGTSAGPALVLATQTPISNEALAGAVHGTIFLNSNLPTSTPQRESRQYRPEAVLANPPTVIPVETSPERANPSRAAGQHTLEIDQPSDLRPISSPAPTTELDSIIGAEPALVDATVASGSELTDLADFEHIPLTDGEAAAASELSDITNPIAVLVATCVIARQIKANRWHIPYFDRSQLVRFWRRVVPSFRKTASHSP